MQIDTRAGQPEWNEIEIQGKGDIVRKDDDGAMINVARIYEAKKEMRKGVVSGGILSWKAASGWNHC